MWSKAEEQNNMVLLELETRTPQTSENLVHLPCPGVPGEPGSSIQTGFLSGEFVFFLNKFIYFIYLFF